VSEHLFPVLVASFKKFLLIVACHFHWHSDGVMLLQMCTQCHHGWCN